MSEICDEYRKNILQGEIAILLHDIGKLHWRFIEPAANGKKCNLSALHTLSFLAESPSDVPDKEALSQLKKSDNPLLKPLSWLQLDDASLTCLGSLLALHHPQHNEDLLSFFSLRKDQDSYPASLLCAMYADTADSLYSKAGRGSVSFPQDKGSIHLAYPLGGIECEITKKSVEADAKGLKSSLADWAKGCEAWDTDTLLQKRDALREILKQFGEHNLAETRIPYNDVTLWQHSYYVAAIYKALLASLLLRGSKRSDWTNLISDNDFVHGDLIHAKQKLALIAVRFNDAAYIERNARSYDIVGRRVLLYNLTKQCKHLVEDELCLGNEIYRDHQGICFIIADIARDGASDGEKAVYKELTEKITALCMGKPFGGELSWKIQYEHSGLRLTDMFRLWNQSFEDIPNIVSEHTPQPVQRGNNTQICPRCGFNPIPWQALRIGGINDKNCCPNCQETRKIGSDVLRSLRTGKGELLQFGKETFGLESIPDISDFFDLVELDEKTAVKDTRLALIQGIIPLRSLYDGTLFTSLLSPCTSSTWHEEEEQFVAAWKKIREHDVSPKKKEDPEHPTGTVLDRVLQDFKGERDGWCAGCEKGHMQRAYIENVILPKKDCPESIEEQARTILLWALQRHPSPSRMARIFEETRGFMYEVFQKASGKSASKQIPFVPLTCDAGRFQLLLPSQQALSFMKEVADLYAQRFGYVRHVLPLHLSASVFYYKTPLYIAMDAARRFEKIAAKQHEQWWQLEDIVVGGSIELVWKTHDDRTVHWAVPATLPDGREDPFHTFFKNTKNEYVSIASLKKGERYAVMPSTFDFEILDSSTRRYDIRIEDTEHFRRPHFMMPRSSGPRPYPLEEISRWFSVFASFFSNSISKSQRKIVLELIARVHNDWDIHDNEEVFDQMLMSICLNTFGNVNGIQDIHAAAHDGTIFDLFEWFDFLNTGFPGE